MTQALITLLAFGFGYALASTRAAVAETRRMMRERLDP